MQRFCLCLQRERQKNKTQSIIQINENLKIKPVKSINNRESNKTTFFECITKLRSQGNQVALNLRRISPHSLLPLHMHAYSGHSHLEQSIREGKQVRMSGLLESPWDIHTQREFTVCRPFPQTSTRCSWERLEQDRRLESLPKEYRHRD